MADRFYSVPIGAQTVDLVTEGSSTSSEAIELRVLVDATSTPLAVLMGLQAITDYIKTKEVTPLA